jgi:hypothetical protein
MKFATRNPAKTSRSDRPYVVDEAPLYRVLEEGVLAAYNKLAVCANWKPYK